MACVGTLPAKCSLTPPLLITHPDLSLDGRCPEPGILGRTRSLILSLTDYLPCSCSSHMTQGVEWHIEIVGKGLTGKLMMNQQTGMTNLPSLPSPMSSEVMLWPRGKMKDVWHSGAEREKAWRFFVIFVEPVNQPHILVTWGERSHPW